MLGLLDANLQFANISSDVGGFQEKLPKRLVVTEVLLADIYGYTRKYVLPAQRQKGVAY